MRVIKSAWEKVPAVVRSKWVAVAAVSCTGVLVGVFSKHVIGGLSSGDQATLISGFGGAGLGALIGGAVSLALAKQTSAEARGRDGDQRKEKAETAALRTLLKLQQITNGIYSIVSHIDKSIASAKEEAIPFHETWEVVRPLVGIAGSPITFETDDLVTLMRGRHLNEINEMLSLQEKLISLEQSLEAYSRLREDYNEFLSPHVDLNKPDQFAGADVPAEIMKEAIRKSKHIGYLMEQIENYARQDLEKGAGLCAHVSNLFIVEFGDDVMPRLRPTQPAEDTSSAPVTGAPPFVSAPPHR